MTSTMSFKTVIWRVRNAALDNVIVIYLWMAWLGIDLGFGAIPPWWEWIVRAVVTVLIVAGCVVVRRAVRRRTTEEVVSLCAVMHYADGTTVKLEPISDVTHDGRRTWEFRVPVRTSDR